MADLNYFEIKEREEETIKLCKQIMDIHPNSVDNPNGADYSFCPICHKETKGIYASTMNEIEHKLDCGYLIAKNLLTLKPL